MPNGDDHRQLTLVELAEMAEQTIENLKNENAKLRKRIEILESHNKALLTTIKLAETLNSDA
ncbi:MAG: hypothetical protein GTO24_21285 [candidate division Zixibacteria bacterium]|nr:hypothetical protein [candidate division Zixibacteria bacterium]